MLVFIHHDTRVVRITGVTVEPRSDWVTHQARNLSMEISEQACEIKFHMRDRDTKFTACLDAVFAAERASIIKTPVPAPRANAVCERVFGTIRRAGLDRMLILGCRYLEVVLAKYDNADRPHRSVDQRAPARLDSPHVPIVKINPTRLRRTDRLGGLIHKYRMVA